MSAARPTTLRRTVALAGAPALVVAGVWVAVAASTGPTPARLAPLPVPGPSVVAAGAVTGPSPAATVSPRPSASWVATVAARTGVPARAVRAYGAAALILATEDPGCRLGWTTLAGIGAVESDHGRHGGSVIGADGVVRPTVLGPPLDGTAGNRAVPDTDGGALDGDTTWDRAVGPMQFIPTTWAASGRSASGGVPDPSSVDDAALTAAAYLCAAGEDMGTAAGWTAAIATYNAPFGYAVAVSDAADAVAAASARA